MSEKEDMQEIRNAVDEAKQPKSFNILSVLAERAYPKASVSVVLDEATAYEAAMLKEQIDEAEKAAAKSPAQKVKLEDLTNKLTELTEKMNQSAYTFHIRGISEGKREELAKEARKKYPIEYDNTPDISAILGGDLSEGRKEKPSPDRDNLFTDLLWKEHIEMIEDPDGNVQDVISYNDVKSLRTNLPLSAMAKVNSSIEKIRTATAVFMMETGEDFLAKP